MRLHAAGLAVGVLLGAAGCGSLEAPERDTSAPLQTERLSYSLSVAEGRYTTREIRITLRNDTGNVAVLLEGLSGIVDFALEEWRGGTWVPRYREPERPPISRVRRLQPGAILPLSWTIEGCRPAACEPVLDIEDGIYRLRIASGYVDSFDDEAGLPGAELALEHRISNRFSLRTR